jgi:hypothetical protein
MANQLQSHRYINKKIEIQKEKGDINQNLLQQKQENKSKTKQTKEKKGQKESKEELGLPPPTRTGIMHLNSLARVLFFSL